MADYGSVAIEVTKRLNAKEEFDIYKIWKEVAGESFETESSIKKGCPRSAYIGLCEAGKIKGIKEGKYRKGIGEKNKNYALVAVELLKEDLDLGRIDHRELWGKVVPNKSYNQQMDVVLALWNKGLIK